ncbi:hypothetical protein BDV96DRAFT_100562 [Lophiotrema nucula]|uniref:Zn(2)-C6 fungal-type domain-containing protein n=1 Tax=Lophiotrema nucula TaxID=690887 RepID=A0A6A5Z826_9PLEO|nr:hypothetical protein BDV96DRAFT_100562 [Lophiotrema nucula]
MVGVPGRSKGCATCRRRKKKCDLQEPICGNCTKGKFVCGGYQRDLIVVQVGPEGKQGSYRTHKFETSQMTTIPVITPLDTRLKILNQSAFEIECSDAFWDTYLPRSGRKELFACYSDPDRVMYRWATWTQTKSTQSRTLKNAMLAVSATNIAWWKNDPIMTRRGMELYGKSLAQMAAALKNPKNTNTLEMIATCRLLALYETLSSAESSTGNWQGHVNGMIELVRLHPPETFASDGLHELFLDVRLNATIAALAARKATWLAEPAWIEKPFKGQLKGAVNVLCDIVLHLPGILEEFDSITIAPLNSESKRRAEKLKDRCWLLDAQLQGWYRSQAIAVKGYIDPAHFAYISLSVGGAPPEDLSDILAHYGLGTLYGMTLYWPACLILYGLMPALHRLFQSSTEDEVDFSTISRMDLVKYTRCIARSVKHFFQPGTGLSEVMAVAFPISCICQSVYSTDLSSPDTTVSDVIHEILKSLDGVDQTAANMWMKTLLTDMYMSHTTGYAGPNHLQNRGKRWLSASKISSPGKHGVSCACSVTEGS